MHDDRMALTVAIATSTAFALAVHVLLPRWDALYAQLQFALPLATRIALGLPGWIALYPLAVIAAGLCWPRKDRRGAAALGAACVLGMLLAAVLLWALALPFDPVWPARE